MAQGDQTDFLGRLKAVLPTGWFPDETPVLDALLTGLAYAYSWVFSLTAYASLQTRIATATDIFLDIVGLDYLGTRISRKRGESDTRFRIRIKREILREKATRAAVIQAVEDLTGQTPTVIEPARPQDCGGYGLPCMGYGVAGRYGSLALHHQAFLIVNRPPQAGLPNVDGYGGSIGGYGIGSIEYANSSMVPNYISDADIYEAISSVQPAAVILWTRIESPQPNAGDKLDDDFILDESLMT